MMDIILPRDIAPQSRQFGCADLVPGAAEYQIADQPCMSSGYSITEPFCFSDHFIPTFSLPSPEKESINVAGILLWGKMTSRLLPDHREPVSYTV